MRKVSSLLVVLIGWLYLLPQLQGAGLTLTTATNAPGWLGGLIVGVVVMVTVAGGGMRSITFVQAFQYWLKVTALSLPVVFMILAWHAHGAPNPAQSTFPVLHKDASVRVESDVTVDVAVATQVRVRGTVDGHRMNGVLLLAKGRHTISTGTELQLFAGSVVPQAVDQSTERNTAWAQPLASTASHDHRCTPPTRWCWPPSSAPWGCRTCWSASTPTPTAGRLGERPFSS